jgi:hypothetical protein
MLTVEERSFMYSTKAKLEKLIELNETIVELLQEIKTKL